MTKICPSAQVKLSKKKKQQVKTRLVNLRLEDDSGLKAGGSASRPEAVNPHTSSSGRMNHSQRITSHKSKHHWNAWITGWIIPSEVMYTVCYRTNNLRPASKRLSPMRFLAQRIGPVEQQSGSQTALFLNFCSPGCVGIVMGYFHASHCC